MKPDTIGAYPIRCVGVSKEELAPLKDRPAEASVTIYADGSRDVGCPFLGIKDGMCQSGAKPDKETRTSCIHLFPATSFVELQDLSQPELRTPLSGERNPTITIQRKDGAEDILAALAKNVRLLRGNHGLSQQDLAERAGVHINTVKNIENSKMDSNPRLKTIESLACVLGATALELLSDFE